MKNVILSSLLLSSALVFAAPPAPVRAGPGPGPGPGAGRFDGERGEAREERREEHQQRMHMAAVVGISEALGLNEAEALKMSEKLRGFEDRRRPIRESMHEAMKTLKAAADGDAAAGNGVDAALQKVLDGRAQMAALDKEMVSALGQGQTPQKKAKLALFLAHFQQQAKGMGFGGRDGHRGFER